MNNKEQLWYDALVKKGHTPFMDENDDLDIFFYESGNHNGPGCSICVWSCCWHCDTIDVIPVCSEKDE